MFMVYFRSIQENFQIPMILKSQLNSIENQLTWFLHDNTFTRTIISNRLHEFTSFKLLFKVA